MTTLGATIRAARERRELSIRALADDLDISAAYLHDIEHNRRIPSEAKMREIANTLLLDFDELLEQSGRLGEQADYYLQTHAAMRVFVRTMARFGFDNRTLAPFLMACIEAAKDAVKSGTMKLPEGMDK